MCVDICICLTIVCAPNVDAGACIPQFLPTWRSENFGVLFHSMHVYSLSHLIGPDVLEFVTM